VEDKIRRLLGRLKVSKSEKRYDAPQKKAKADRGRLDRSINIDESGSRAGEVLLTMTITEYRSAQHRCGRHP
jgi:hypothetical protein